MNKRTLDAIARRYSFKSPARWTPEDAGQLCDYACTEYDKADHDFAPLHAQDRTLGKEIERKKRELQKVREVLSLLKKLREPTQWKKELLDAARAAEGGILGHIQMIRDGFIFDGTPKPASKKKGRGRSPGEITPLLGDMATVFRELGATTLTAEAKQVKALLNRHGIPCAGMLSVRDSLRRLRK